MAQLGAAVNNSVFRKDWKLVIAANRHLAVIHGVNLQYDALGYEPGQVLAPTGAGASVYGKYSALSGSQKATCVLLDYITATESSGTATARGVFAGEVYNASLVDGSAQAIIDLNAKSFALPTGSTIVKF